MPSESWRSARSGHLGVLGTVGIGVAGGTAWMGALRAVMAEVAGSDSDVHWLGTFGFILLPGAVAGGLLAWGFSRQSRGLVQGERWLTFAPLVLGLDPSALPVPLAFIGLGFAFSGRGRRGARVLAGCLSAGLLVVVPFVPSMLNPALAVTTPRGAWLALLTASLLTLGAAAEIRLQAPRGEPSWPTTEVGSSAR